MKAVNLGGFGEKEDLPDVMVAVSRWTPSN